MKTQRYVPLSCLLAAAVLTSACAAQRQAGEFSGELLAQTIAYENQLVDLARGTQSHGTEIRKWAATHSVNAYRTNSESAVKAQAEDAVERIKPTGLTASDIRTFVAAYHENTKANVAKVNDKLEEIGSRTKKTLSALKREIKPLAVARAKLEKLQRGPSFSDYIATLRPILDEFKAQF